MKKLPTTQPTSSNEKKQKAHEHRIKMIEKYVAPLPSTPKPKKLKFSQELPELQTFNKEELVTKIKWSWKGTIVGCERSILKRVKGRIRTAEWKRKRMNRHSGLQQQVHQRLIKHKNKLVQPNGKRKG